MTEEKDTYNSFTNSLIHLPLISAIACLILLLLLIAMYFSKVFHIIMITAMAIATGFMFYTWWQSR